MTALPVLTAEIDGWDVVRLAVAERDAGCVFSPRPPMDRRGPANGLPDHFCRNRYAAPILWYRYPARAMLDQAELNHVKEEPMAAVKAPDDTAHLVMVCYGAHHGGLATSADGLEYQRAWLAHFYPVVWAVFLERRAAALHEAGQ